MNIISFEINNGQTMQLVQRQHNGKTLIIIKDDKDNHETIPDSEAFIDPGEFVMLINYFRNCKQGMEESNYISKANFKWFREEK